MRRNQCIISMKSREEGKEDEQEAIREEITDENHQVQDLEQGGGGEETDEEEDEEEEG